MENLKLTFEISEEALMVPVKNAVANKVNEIVRHIVNVQIEKRTSEIEKVVEVHLAKRLTDEKIKQMIDAAAQQFITERLEDM